MKIIMVIKNMRADSGVCSSVAAISNELEFKGHSVYIASLTGSGPMINRLRIDRSRIVDLSNHRGLVMKGLALRKFVQKEEITIIHAHMHHAVVTGYIAGVCTKVKLAITEHSTLMPAKNWLAGFIENSIDSFISRHAHTRIAVSRSVAGTWAARTFNLPTNIHVIPNAVDTSFALNVRERTMDPNQYRLLFLGRLAYEKNAKLVLRIIHMLRDRGLNIELIVAGSGLLDKEIEAEIRELDLTKSVHLIGAATNVPELLHSSEALILASYWEGCPMSILEAYVCKTPVIGTRVPGIMDVVDHLETGILIDLEPTETDINNIVSMLTNKQLSKKIKAGASLKASLFRPQCIAERHIELYGAGLQ